MTTSLMSLSDIESQEKLRLATSNVKAEVLKLTLLSGTLLSVIGEWDMLHVSERIMLKLTVGIGEKTQTHLVSLSVSTMMLA